MAINQYEDMILNEKEASVTPAAPAVPKYEAVVQEENEAQVSSIAQSMNYAVEKEPSRMEKAIKMANEIGLDVPTVERNLEDIQKKKTISGIDYESMVRDTPGVAKFMEKPENAAFARDDMESMGKIEKAVKFIPKKNEQSSMAKFGSEMYQGGETGWNNMTANVAALVVAEGLGNRDWIEAQAMMNKRAKELSDKRPNYSKEFQRVMQEESEDVAAGFEKLKLSYKQWTEGEKLKALQSFVTGDIETVAELFDMMREAVWGPERIKGLVYGATESLAASTPAVGLGVIGATTGPAALVTVPSGVFVGTAAIETGATINSLLESKGVDITDPDALENAYKDTQLMSDIRSQARRKGLTTGAVEGLVSIFGGQMLGKLGKVKAPTMTQKVVARAADTGVEMLGESVGQIGGELAQYEGDLSKVDIAGAIQEGVMSLGSSFIQAGQSGAVKAEMAGRRALYDRDAKKAATQILERTDRAESAISSAQNLQEIGKVLKETKNLKNIPEKISELVEASTGGEGASAVYFQTDDFDGYWSKKGVNPVDKAAEIMGDNGKAYLDAKTTGGSFEVPLEKYASTVGTTEDFDGLLPITRTSPDAMSLTEAQDHLKSLPSVIQQVAVEATQAQEIVAPVEQAISTRSATLKKDIQEKLVAAGRPVREAKFAAQQVEAFFKTTAQRYGMSMQQFEDFILKYNPTINQISQPFNDQGNEETFNQDSLNKLQQNANKLKEEGFDIFPSENPTFDDDGEETVGPAIGEPGYSFTVNAQDSSGNDIGQARFLINEDGDLIADDDGGNVEAVTVDASFRRKGIATEMYRQAAEHVGKPIQNMGGQTDLGKKLRESLRDLDDQTFYQSSLTPEQRIARAKKLGFNTEKVLYHGGPLGITDFKTNPKGANKYLEGVYMTPLKGDAERYAEMADGKDKGVYEFYAPNAILNLDSESDVDTAIEKMGLSVLKPKKSQVYKYNPEMTNLMKMRLAVEKSGVKASQVDKVLKEKLQSAGYKGMFTDNDQVTVVFDPKDVRSVTADFNEGESTNIYYQKAPTKKQIKELNEIITREIEERVGKEIGLKVETSGEYYRNHEDFLDQDDTQIDRDIPVRMTLERKKRALDAGFDVSHSWFHGTKANIVEFSDYTLGSSTGAGSARMAHFFASSPQTASDYALASDDARSLRTSREYNKAKAAVKEFESKMLDKYGERWLKRMNGEDTKAFNDLDAEVIRTEEEYSDSLVAKTDTTMIDHNIKRVEESISYLEEKIKNGENNKENEESQKYVDELKQLVDGTTFVKAPDGAGFNIIDKNGNKIPNKMNKGKDGDILFRFWDSKETLQNRIEKIELRILNNSTESLLKTLDEYKKDLIEKQSTRFKMLEGVDQEVVYQTVLRMDAPLIVDFNGAEYREVTYREILEIAQNYGFDGVIFKNTYDPAFIGPARNDILMDVAAVFSPTQIRSTNAEFKNLDSPNILFQDSNTPLGQIRFGETGINIDLLSGANPSTFMHEMAHAYLKIMIDLQDGQNVPQEVKDDFAKILEFLEVDSSEKIGVEQHEKFARGFEAYLREGRAPSDSLRKAFANFKAWLLTVYKNLKELRVELNPEIRGVFDRMLATEEEIALAKNSISGEFDMQKLDVPTEKQMEHMKAVMDWQTKAEEALMSKIMADYERQKQAEYREKKKVVQAEVEQRANQMLTYRAISLMRDGTKPDGSPLDEGAFQFKLERSSIEKMFSKEIVSKLPAKIVSPIKQGGGLDVEIAAGMLGFEDANQMITMLLNTPKYNDYVKAVTDQEMKKLYPEVYEEDHETLKAEAMEYVHDELGSKVKRMQLEMIAEKAMPVLKEGIRNVARRLPSNRQIKMQAEKVIGSMKSKDIRPVVFLRAERKAAKEAGVLLARGDFEGAYKQKERELYNFELYRAAISWNDQYKSALNNFKKIYKSDEKVAKTRDMDLVNAARAILATYGVGKAGKSAEDYLEKMKAYDPDTYETISSLVEGSLVQASSLEEMTADDFIAVRDAVFAIWDLSKTSMEHIVDGKALNREEVITSLNNRIGEITPSHERVGYDQKATAWQETVVKFLGVKAAIRRVESWTDAMGGPFKKMIYGPVSDAVNKYRDERKVYLRKFKDLTEKYSKTQKGLFDKKIIDAVELKRMDPDGVQRNYKFTYKGELVGALLHMGNESNFKKLLAGRKWGTLNDDGTINSTQWDLFIKRMHDEGVLTKEDWDYVQSLWDLMEELKPNAQKAHKQMYGYYFNEVTANPITTPFGTYRGGYAPAVADSFISEDGRIKSEKEALEKMNNTFMFPTTGRGFTKKRVENYVTPLSIDLRLVAGHIDKVMRFTHIEPAVKSVSRIVMNKDFRYSLTAYDPTVGSDLLVPWLQRAAQQRVSTPSSSRAADAFFGKIRQNAGMNAMFFNVTNALQQFTGLSISLLKVKPKHLRNALWTYTRSPMSSAKYVTDKSSFMNARMDKEMSNIMRNLEEMLTDENAFDKGKKVVQNHAYFIQSAFQNIVDVTTWIGAYEQAVESGISEPLAIKEADSAVRLTQGSLNAEDVSRFETGSPFVRVFTMFASYFNMLANTLTTELYSKNIRELGLRKGFGRALYVYFFGFAVPAVLSEAIVKAMSGADWDEDDDDSVLDDAMNLFFASQFRTATAMVPVVGTGMALVYNQFDDAVYNDRLSTSPAISTLESALVGNAKNAYTALFTDKDVNKKKATKDFLSGLSMLTGVPMGQIGKTAGYAIDVAEGKANPENPVEAVRGAVTGRTPR